MNILFLSLDQMSKFFCSIANVLKNNEFSMKIDKFYFLTETDIFKNFIINNSPKDNTEVINIYEDFNLNKVKNYELEDLQRFEDLFGIPNLWLYVITERKYCNLSLNKTYDVLCWHLEFFENLYKKAKIDFVVMPYECGFIGLSMKKVADYYGIPNLYITNSRINNRIIVTNHLYMFPMEFEKKYNEYVNRELNENELKIAKEILAMYREKKIKPSFYKTYSTVSKFSGLLKIFKKIKKYYFGGLSKTYNLSDILKYSTYSRKLRFYYFKIFFFKFFKEPDIDDKYYYFPLNYQPEITVDLMAPYYIDQKIIIDFVTKSMPAGYYLYVKDHPHAYGLRPINYYKEISKNPRVKLIKTEVNSYDLFERSIGVIALTGTAGWEAILFGKPVIVFGQVFYKMAKGIVYSVNDIYKLPYILKEAIKNYSPGEDNILKLCYIYYNYTYPGIIGPPSDNPYILSDENIQNVVNALVTEYKKLKQS